MVSDHNAPAIETGAGAEADASCLSPGERAHVYRWLSGVFAREPSVETLEIYRTPDGRALLDGMESIAPLTPLVDAFRSRISTTGDAPLTTVALDLAGEYARLFLGVGGRRSGAAISVLLPIRRRQADATSRGGNAQRAQTA